MREIFDYITELDLPVDDKIKLIEMIGKLSSDKYKMGIDMASDSYEKLINNYLK